MNEANTQYDVIIVGAGPSGSTAAQTCANQGLRTLLIEQSRTPGKKICAGALSLQVLRNFKVEEEAIDLHIDKTLIFHGSRLIREKKKSVACAATVHRQEFDTYLAKRAVEEGAELQTSTHCSAVLRENKTIGVLLRTPGGLRKVESKVVIAADGVASTIARSAAFHGKLRRQDLSLAVQYEFVTGHNAQKDRVCVRIYNEKWSRLGYGWVFPKKKGYTVGIGCLLSHTRGTELVRNLEKFVHHLKASKVLGKAKRGCLQAACVPAKPRYPIYGKRIVFIGDSAGQVSPLSGEGILYAMTAGKLAGDVIAEAISTEGENSSINLSQYGKRWDSSYGKELGQQRIALEALINLPNPVEIITDVIEADEPLVAGILARHDAFRLEREFLHIK